MFIVKYYLSGAIIALIFGLYAVHWQFSIILYWLSLSLFGVSAAYIFDAPAIFRKRNDGTIPFYVNWVFFPFLLGAQIYNSWARKTDKVPAIQEINPKLYLACRLFPSDVEFLKENGIGAILDATSEFSGLNWSANDENLAYRNVPILDHKAPHAGDLQDAINWIDHQIKSNRGVVIHCALGRGRSVLIMAAYLLAKDICDSIEDALSHINQIRGTANLNSEQYKKLKKLHEAGKLKPAQSALLIVNPVAGGGNWAQHAKNITERLLSKYQLTVIETTPDKSAKQIAKENMDKQFSVFVACGGDGTVNEVASQIVNTEQKMAIIPLGTTNAMAHVLFGIKSKLDPAGVACDVILEGHASAIDTATCNQDIVLLLAGIGFEQKMIEDANRSKKDEQGQLAYINALVNAVEENKMLSVKLAIDDEEPVTKKLSSLIIANAAPLSTVLAQGGDQPNINDGLLDMTILDTSEHKVLPLIAVGANTIKPQGLASDDAPGLEHRQVTKVTISSKDEISYAVDGETRNSNKVTIKVNPSSLNIVLPNG